MEKDLNKIDWNNRIYKDRQKLNVLLSSIEFNEIPDPHAPLIKITKMEQTLPYTSLQKG